MRYVGRLGGGTPTLLKFQIGETMANAGVPVVIAGSSQEGLQLATTTAAVNMVGITFDTATVVAAQQTDNATTDRFVTVVVNPDAIIEAKLSGGATADTALTEGIEDTGSATGLLVSTNVDYSSPSMDEGCLVCSRGANAGVVRKITSLSGADGVPTVAFPFDTAVGDRFIVLPYAFSGTQGSGLMGALDAQFVQLTSAFTQVDASVAVDANNNNLVPFRLRLSAQSDTYDTDSHIQMTIFDHLFGQS